MGSTFFSKRLHFRMKSRGKRIRPKTFKSEDSAKVYIKAKNIGQCTVSPKGKKFVIVKNKD